MAKPCARELDHCVDRLRWLIHRSEGQRKALPARMQALAIAPAGVGRDFIPGGGHENIAVNKGQPEKPDRGRPECRVLHRCEPF